MFKKLRYWFYNRKRMIQHIESLTQALAINFKDMNPVFYQLDQNKTYLAIIDNKVPVESIREAIAVIQSTTPWTLPYMIFMTDIKLKEIDKKTYDKLRGEK